MVEKSDDGKITLSGIMQVFGKPVHGRIYDPEAFKKAFSDAKIRGIIKDFEIDDKGVKIIKEFDVIGYNLTPMDVPDRVMISSKGFKNETNEYTTKDSKEGN